jgi:hypothetical protein
LRRRKLVAAPAPAVKFEGEGYPRFESSTYSFFFVPLLTNTRHHDIEEKESLKLCRVGDLIILFVTYEQSIKYRWSISYQVPL